MSIRRTIILLTVPLFLALAIVNGALLYFQEKAELSRALSDQAIAAAVTGAEFIASMERPHEQLAQPLRAKALATTAQHITGLDGLYLIRPGSAAQTLVAPRTAWQPTELARPAKPSAQPAQIAGRRYIVALAPTAHGGFVAARIDAEPMFAQMTAIRRAILLIVLIAGLTATALAWVVARRIVRELEMSRTAIAAIGAETPPTRSDELTIRETRDLADAVSLMEASGKAAEDRSRRVAAHQDRERTLASALAAKRSALFAPVTQSIARSTVTARLCGDAPMGGFFAICAGADRGMVIIGRCGGKSPRDELDHAVAARHFLEENMFAVPPEQCLAAARSAHAIEDMRVIEWTAAAPPSPNAIVLADPATEARVATYALRNADASPTELIDGIEALLQPSGLFAAVGRA